jgi:hypothetical protein
MDLIQHHHQHNETSEFHSSSGPDRNLAGCQSSRIDWAKKSHQYVRWRNIASLTMSALSSSVANTLRHALMKERHFALVEDFAFPTKARL